MSPEILLASIFESSVLFIFVGVTFRLVPGVSPDCKAWIWRLVFLKALIGLLPFAVVTMRVLGPVEAGSSRPEAPRRLAEADRSRVDESPEGATPGNPFTVDPWFAVWIFGVGAASFTGVRERFRATRVVQTAEPVANPALRQALQDLVDRAGTQRPRLLCSSDARSAMLIAGRGSTIVLPRSAAEAGSVSDTRLMIAHEVAHLARRDLTWFGAIWLVQSLFFFNPIVWLAARDARQDHESATDRRAAELAGTSIQTYAEMLLRATVVARTPLIPAAIPMAESYRTIHRRLEAMTYFNRKPTLSRTLATIAVAAVTVGLIPTYVPSAVASPGKPQTATQDTNYVRQGDNPTIYSAEFEQKDIRLALQQVFNVTHKSFQIDPRVKGSITVAVQNVTFDTLLENMVRQVDARYRIEKDTYVVYPVPPSQRTNIYSPPLPSSYPPINIDVSVKQEDVRQTLLGIWRQVRRSFRIDPSVQGAVSLQAKHEPLESVLTKILAQVDSEFHIEKGVYVIRRKKPSANANGH